MGEFFAMAIVLVEICLSLRLIPKTALTPVQAMYPHCGKFHYGRLAKLLALVYVSKFQVIFFML